VRLRLAVGLMKARPLHRPGEGLPSASPPRSYLGAGGETELVPNGLHVAFGGPLRDEQPVADLTVGQALGHQLGNLPLPTAEGCSRSWPFKIHTETRTCVRTCHGVPAPAES